MSWLRDWFRKNRFPHEGWLLLAALLTFTLASVKSGFTIHYRYVLAALPFMAIFSGRLWGAGAGCTASRRVSIALAGCGVISSLAVYPHSIAYFHELVGGPRQGGRYLLHSSLDWGQDVYKLADWFEQHRAGHSGELRFQVHGAVSPHMLGIPENSVPRRRAESRRRRELEDEITPGVYIVGVSYLYGANGAFCYLDALEPCGHIGYTIKIYDVTQQDIDARGWNEILR